MPGQDASKSDVMSKAVANKLHTVAVVSAYEAKMAELRVLHQSLNNDP